MTQKDPPLADKLKGQAVTWLPVKQEVAAADSTTASTEAALDRAELLWGVSDRTKLFRQLLAERGMSIYDNHREHHFTGSTIVLDPETHKILMTFHPWYKLWLQLGGHDEGMHDPVAISAREAWEESGITNLWICDWPVRIDPHPAHKCKAVAGKHHNWHYDICYMVVAYDTNHQISEESEDLHWFSLAELRQLIERNEAQQRALEMAQNALALYEALVTLGVTPPPASP